MKLHKKSQKGIILNYMQKHPEKEIDATIFMRWWNFVPFVWASANSRISELANKWFVKHIGYTKWVMSFFKKSRDRKLWRITQKWLDFNLS